MTALLLFTAAMCALLALIGWLCDAPARHDDRNPS